MGSAPPQSLAADQVDEIVVTGSYINGQPNLNMMFRRTVYKEGAILLSKPRLDNINESEAIGWLHEIIKIAGVSAIQFKESQSSLISGKLGTG